MSAGRNEDVPLEKYRRPASPPPLTPLHLPVTNFFRRVIRLQHRAALMTSSSEQEPLLGGVRLDSRVLSDITRCDIRVFGTGVELCVKNNMVNDCSKC